MKTTIIILLILAGVSLNAIVGDNGIINNAMDAKVISKFSGYNEELGITSVNDVGIYATGENLKKYIPSMEDEDLEKFVVIKSKLLYVGTDEKETEIADRLGIGGGSETSDAGATVKEVQAIVDGVVKVSEKNKEKIPKNDSDRLDELECKDDEKGLIGTRLFDRNGLNLTERTWNILIEYNNQNKETARFGSGYYWLKKGETYKIKGKEIEFKNDYVINYGNEEFTVLSGRAVNWNEKATLGVDTNIALNLDPMSFAVGRWEKSGDTDEVNKEEFEDFIVKDTDGKEKNTGIQKVGDVKYNDENKSLEFNKSGDNEKGEGGYIKLLKDELDFSNGFTFEIYCNLDRLRYDNGSNMSSLGLFCRISGLKENFKNSMRFGWCYDNLVCRIGPGVVVERLDGTNGSYVQLGGFRAGDCGYDVGEDFYLTVTYSNNGSSNDGTIKYYINGNKILYDCKFPNAEYVAGLKNWNLDSCPFFLGVCPWDQDGNLYYLKGSVYSCRLYTSPLSPDKVKLNYDMTLKYRDSFKDEKF